LANDQNISQGNWRIILIIQGIFIMIKMKKA